MKLKKIEALIVWHLCNPQGHIIGFSSERFSGTLNKLQKTLKIQEDYDRESKSDPRHISHIPQQIIVQ
jgi:hypothetical protein